MRPLIRASLEFYTTSMCQGTRYLQVRQGVSYYIIPGIPGTWYQGTSCIVIRRIQFTKMATYMYNYRRKLEPEILNYQCRVLAVNEYVIIMSMYVGNKQLGYKTAVSTQYRQQRNSDKRHSSVRASRPESCCCCCCCCCCCRCAVRYRSCCLHAKTRIEHGCC